MEFLFSLFLIILIFIVSYMGAHNLEYEHECAMTFDKRSKECHRLWIEVEIRSEIQKSQYLQKKNYEAE